MIQMKVFFAKQLVAECSVESFHPGEDEDVLASQSMEDIPALPRRDPVETEIEEDIVENEDVYYTTRKDPKPEIANEAREIYMVRVNKHHL